jgi:predicted AAA+ superfamily ATPase
MTVPAWHQLCTLREDVRTGRLTLDEFAADLNGVRTGESPAVYREATMFFSRTYPTFRMKQLVRDVLLRLAGEGGKPVQQLQVAYGGGKTHTLITLLHLAEQGQGLADHRTVQEFVTFAGLPQPPQARVALLPFDKFDVREVGGLGPGWKHPPCSHPLGSASLSTGR